MQIQRLLGLMLILVVGILGVLAIVFSLYQKNTSPEAGLNATQQNEVRKLIDQEMKVNEMREASAAAALTPTATPTPTRRPVITRPTITPTGIPAQ